MSTPAQQHEGGSRWLALAGFVAVCFAASGLGSIFTGDAIREWYAFLDKPSWTPPNWLFGPVWTLLYFLMAVAAWLVWRRCGFKGAARGPLVLFGVQLVFNALWTLVFFGLRRPGLAFAEIVLLWCLILATLAAFLRVERVAGLLLVPYLLWVTYAAALNFALWRLND